MVTRCGDSPPSGPMTGRNIRKFRALTTVEPITSAGTQPSWLDNLPGSMRFNDGSIGPSSERDFRADMVTDGNWGTALGMTGRRGLHHVFDTPQEPARVMWGIGPANTRCPVVAATRPARISGASLTIRCRSSDAWPSRLATRKEAAPACQVRQAWRSLTLLRISAGPIPRLSPAAGSIFALPLLLGSAAA